MSLTKAIRDYLLTCPYLSEGVINVDYLSNNIDEYSIDKLSSEPVIKTYVDGSTLRQYQFALTSIKSYSSDYLNNIKNNDFYDLFEKWISQQNEVCNFPKNLEESIYAIEVIKDNYMILNDTDKAKYQIQLRILYRRN